MQHFIFSCKLLIMGTGRNFCSVGKPNPDGGGGGSGKFFKHGAIRCVSENILLKFCKKNCKNVHFYIKIIYNVLMRTLYLGVLEHILPRFLVNCATWCVLEHIFRELSLKKIYINFNNIDMLLLRTSYRYGVFLE